MLFLGDDRRTSVKCHRRLYTDGPISNNVLLQTNLCSSSSSSCSLADKAQGQSCRRWRRQVLLTPSVGAVQKHSSTLLVALSSLLDSDALSILFLPFFLYICTKRGDAEISQNPNRTVWCNSTNSTVTPEIDNE